MKKIRTTWRLPGLSVAIAIAGFAAVACNNSSTPNETQHTVTFSTNGGSTIALVQVLHGQTVARPADPTMSGHTFGGWYTTAALTVEYNFDMPVTGPLTLYARWVVEQTPGPHKVTFNTNEGSEIAPVQVLHGQAVARPADPAMSGHTFGGWYTDNGVFENRFDFFDTPITMDTTLYARWVPPTRITVNLGGDIEMGMTWIAPGIFMRGPELGLVHEVTLTQGFFMAIHPVTQEQFERVMGVNPSHFSATPAPGEVQVRRPVERVNWYHAIAFANRLSILQGLEPVYNIAGMSSTDADAWLYANVPAGWNEIWEAVIADWDANGFRLATDAEWEFAARAGTTTRWSFGDTDDDIDYYAWTTRNNITGTHEVGRLRPNAWGLYDMHVQSVSPTL